VNLNKESLSAMRIFVKHKSVRIAYYLGVGAIYLFAASAFVKAIRWW
jgi:hypothetical protein